MGEIKEYKKQINEIYKEYCLKKTLKIFFFFQI